MGEEGRGLHASNPCEPPGDPKWSPPLLMTNTQKQLFKLHSFVVLFPQAKRNRVAALRGCAKDARNTVEHIIWHECSMAQWRKQSTAQKCAANS
jgi:hypothetical protein